MASGFADFVAELFEPLGGVSMRRMFGSLGVFRDGAMFGIVTDDVLYLKVDAETVAPYDAEGCETFSYDTKNGLMEIARYRRVPERLFDEPDEFLHWARASAHAAARIADEKPAKRKRPRT